VYEHVTLLLVTYCLLPSSESFLTPLASFLFRFVRPGVI